MGRERQHVSNSPLITEYYFGESDLFPGPAITERQTANGSLACELQQEKLSLEREGLYQLSHQQTATSQSEEGNPLYTKHTTTTRHKSCLLNCTNYAIF